MEGDLERERRRRHERQREHDREVEAALSRHINPPLLAWLAADAETAARRVGERHHVEFGLRYQILVAGFWLATLCTAVVVIFFVDDRPGNGPVDSTLLVATVAVPTLWLHAICINFTLAYDAAALHIRNRWGRWTHVPWDRVHSVKISRGIEGFRILLKDHPPVAMSLMMSGHQSLVAEIRQRTDPDEFGTQ